MIKQPKKRYSAGNYNATRYIILASFLSNFKNVRLRLFKYAGVQNSVSSWRHRYNNDIFLRSDKNIDEQ